MIDRKTRDDFERIRLSRAGFIWPEPDLSGGGVPAFVGQVTSSAAQIGVGKFLLVRPTFVLGQESEGASGNFTPIGSSTVPVYLIGPGLASTGDFLVCKFVDNRWVAERTTPSSGGGTGGGVTIPTCFCPEIPATLTMISGSSTCNFHMFQSCTIAYSSIPSVYDELDLGSYAFLSTETFPDPLADGALFQYMLTCFYNQFALTRLYAESPYGSPFRDAVLYTWFVGSYGNTCSPFHLDNGVVYPGSDPTCFVTIDGAP
jgi:hypothetical protein